MLLVRHGATLCQKFLLSPFVKLTAYFLKLVMCQAYGWNAYAAADPL